MTGLAAAEYGPLLYGMTGVTEPDRLWSLANFGELITAPVTPLCWSVWHQGLETGSRAAYADFGVLSARRVPAPSDPNGLLGACFAGRIALNIDFTRTLMAAIPGASGDGFERDIVGKVRPNRPPDRLDPRRLPALTVKAPVLLARAAGNTRAGQVEMAQWWRHEVLAAPPAEDLGAATRRFREALGRVRRAARAQAGSRFVVMAVQTQLVALCERVGRPELANQVLAGVGGTPEARLADEMWLAGRGERTCADLLRSHGYYGVHIGNMTGRSWRQEPGLLRARINAAAARDDARRPADREAEAHTERQAAIRRLRSAQPALVRPLAGRLAASAATQFRALEYGKAAVMMAVDGCRAAAHEVGTQLRKAGPWTPLPTWCSCGTTSSVGSTPTCATGSRSAAECGKASPTSRWTRTLSASPRSGAARPADPVSASGASPGPPGPTVWPRDRFGWWPTRPATSNPARSWSARSPTRAGPR
ncbi:MAG TPA: hypothetical protein VGH89_05370 [Pseudonocardia sp.]|jgi:pyruvate,water dikinase